MDEKETKEILEDMKSMMKAMVEDDELISLSAQLLKKTRDALMKAGFTKAEATQIVAAQNMKVNKS